MVEFSAFSSGSLYISRYNHTLASFIHFKNVESFDLLASEPFLFFLYRLGLNWYLSHIL